MARISMNVYAKHYAMDTKDVTRERINISRLIEKTHEALKDKRTKMSRLSDAPMPERKVERNAPTIDSVTRNTKYMNRSVKDPNDTGYVYEAVEVKPRDYKRTIFVTFVNGKTLVQA